MPKLYEVQIELLDVEPLVWRRILIPDDMSLIHIGAVIMGAMGWDGGHMFAFEIGGKRYDIKFDDGLDIQDAIDMAGIIGRDVFRPGVEASFQYDFGDDWWHKLEFLVHRAVATGDKPPRCIDGKNACPPDDVGGPFGFAELLDAVADAEHPDHIDARDFLEGYSVTSFDIKKADRGIKKMLKAYST